MIAARYSSTGGYRYLKAPAIRVTNTAGLPQSSGMILNAGWRLALARSKSGAYPLEPGNPNSPGRWCGMRKPLVTFHLDGNRTVDETMEWLEKNMPREERPWPKVADDTEEERADDTEEEWIVIEGGTRIIPGRHTMYGQHKVVVKVSRKYIYKGPGYFDPENPIDSRELHSWTPNEEAFFRARDGTLRDEAKVIEFILTTRHRRMPKGTPGAEYEVEITGFEISAYCYDRDFLDYFHSRLREMADEWPESRDEIDAYLQAPGSKEEISVRIGKRPGTAVGEGEPDEAGQDGSPGEEENELVRSGSTPPQRRARRGRPKGTDQWRGSRDTFLAHVAKAVDTLRTQKKTLTKEATAEEMRQSLPSTISAGNANNQTGMDGRYLLQVAQKRYKFVGWEDLLAAALDQLEKPKEN